MPPPTPGVLVPDVHRAGPDDHVTTPGPGLAVQGGIVPVLGRQGLSPAPAPRLELTLALYSEGSLPGSQQPIRALYFLS